MRLAVAGSRVDLLRLVLTVLGTALATLALLAAATVAATGVGDGPYVSELLNQPGLHPGVVIALVGLCVPVLMLLAQCSRIGAPARDRRLAAIRLGGATPGEVGRIVAAEAGVGAVLGSGLGVVAHFVLRMVLGSPVQGSFDRAELISKPNCVLQVNVPFKSALRVPTDVVPPWWVIVLIALAVPVLVAGATIAALRRVALTPFGVTRRARTRPPRVLPLLLVAVGVGMFFLAAALLKAAQNLPGAVLSLLLLGGFVIAMSGLLSGQGALTQGLGRLLVSRTSRPALLLAARRMIADPFGATRATAVMTVAVLIAAGARHLRNVTLAEQNGSDDPLFTTAYDLVDLVLLIAAVLAALGLLVAAAEGIVARRRTYAAVVATGTPRGVIARAVLAEMTLPLIPSLLLASMIGTAAAIGLFGRTTQGYTASDAAGNLTTVPGVTVGLSWGALALTLAIAIGTTLVTTSASLVFLRRATDVSELRAAA